MVKVTKKRLIDVDALRQTMESNLYWGLDSDGAILDTIDDAPIVDAVEVVHGNWVAVPSSDMMTGKAYKCSECGKMRYGSFMPNYCQNCGAKMDGGS